MCQYKKLKATQSGCIIECKRCDRIQVAFGNLVVSYTRVGFLQLVTTVEELFSEHRDYPFRSEKKICVPTASRAVTMIYSVDELHDLLLLLRDGKKEPGGDRLLVFSKN